METSPAGKPFRKEVIPLNLNLAIRPRSLIETLIEAEDRGFTMIRTPAIGVTQSLPDFAVDLLSTHVDYQNYARYGSYIIRLSDAWKETPEIYELT